MRNDCRTAKILATLLISFFAIAERSLAEGSARAAGTPLGFRGDFTVSGLVAPSYNPTDDRPLLAAGGYSLGIGLEFRAGQWIPIRSQTTIYSTGHSSVDESLFLYRAFWGFRWAAETGYGFKIEQVELDLLGGGAISASKYTGTALVSAYYSLVAEPRLLIPITIKSVPGFKLIASLPFEYMWRGSTRTFAAGLGAGVSIPLGKAAGK
jgi:hypothetical protein